MGNPQRVDGDEAGSPTHSEPRWIDENGTAMRATLSLWAALAIMLAGCETPQPTAPIAKPEVVIQVPIEKVTAAVKRTLADRGYLAGKAEGGTLTFDRTADLGPSALNGFLYDKQAWRRIRITLVREGTGTRLTASGAVVTNRGTADEREERDASAGGAHQMQAVLEQIRERAQAGN